MSIINLKINYKNNQTNKNKKALLKEIDFRLEKIKNELLKKDKDYFLYYLEMGYLLLKEDIKNGIIPDVKLDNCDIYYNKIFINPTIKLNDIV